MAHLSLVLMGVLFFYDHYQIKLNRPVGRVVVHLCWTWYNLLKAFWNSWVCQTGLCSSQASDSLDRPCTESAAETQNKVKKKANQGVQCFRGACCLAFKQIFRGIKEIRRLPWVLLAAFNISIAVACFPKKNARSVAVTRLPKKAGNLSVLHAFPQHFAATCNAKETVRSNMYHQRTRARCHFYLLSV